MSEHSRDDMRVPEPDEPAALEPDSPTDEPAPCAEPEAAPPFEPVAEPAAANDVAPDDTASPDTVEIAGAAKITGADAAEPKVYEPTNGGRSARHRNKSKKKNPKLPRTKHKAPWWELPALVALAIAIAIAVKTFLIQPFYIPSESMEKTLHGSAQFGHDRILVNKVIYDFRDPEPGDVVVFDAPPGWNEIHSQPPSNPILHGIRWFGQLVGFVPPDSEVLVKRVIAVGGQTVWGVANADGRSVVHVRDKNGKEHVLNEHYVWNNDRDNRATFGPVTIPKGRLWVMGDHRNDSQDSRYHCGADGTDTGVSDKTCDPNGSTVPIGDVIGKAFVVAWPPSHWRTLGTPSTFDQLASGVTRAVPGAAGVVAVAPLFFLRRRRRRR